MLSTIRDRSSSAMQPMMVTNILPIGARGVDVLAGGDELDPEVVQFVHDRQEMLDDRATRSKPQPGRWRTCARWASASMASSPAAWPWSRRADVRVLMDNLESTACGQLAQLVKLGLDVLVGRADPGIDCSLLARCLLQGQGWAWVNRAQAFWF